MTKVDLFSESIVEPEVSPIPITSEVEEAIQQQSIDGLQMVQNNMAEYSLYVAAGRAYPQLIDGAKSAYKRAIYGMWKDGGSKMQKVAELAAYALPYHPHPTSVSGVIVQLGEFGNKLRLMDTQGNWGDSSRGIEASADRYIEGRLSSTAKQLVCDSLEYGTFITGEIDHDEPLALPTLIPLCFINGQEGIPAGLPKLNIPCLNISEMFDYYIDLLKHKNMDYIPKLIPSLNTDLEMLSTADEWAEVIKKGNGTVKLAPKMELKDNVITISALPPSKDCDTICKLLDKEIAQEKIDVRDESAKDIRIVIEKVYRKSCDMQEVFDRLKKKLTISQTFNLCFFMDKKIYAPCCFDKVVKTNLQYLINTHNNRIEKELTAAQDKLFILQTIEKMKTANIKNLFDRNYDDAVTYISQKYKCKEEVAKNILSKPMSYLTKAHQDEIVDLTNCINSLTTDKADIWTFLLKKYRSVKKEVMAEIKRQSED